MKKREKIRWRSCFHLNLNFKVTYQYVGFTICMFTRDTNIASMDSLKNGKEYMIFYRETKSKVSTK